MDLPATQAMDDEDFVPTQKVTDDNEPTRSLIGMLIISDDLQHQIFSGYTIIGRLPTCTILLNDETVSKRHAEIEAESTEKAIFIKDLGSSNKTKLNGTRLRSNASYQIKDNDRLNFGKVAATFKIHRPAEDSFVACTPQVNRRAVIPDTPDLPMNNSSALEGGMLTIPETQADEDDSCFRRPQIPVRTSSISNELESPKPIPFSLDDVPSPLSNRKNDDDISGVETQRFTVDKTKEMTDNSIYAVETQKFIAPEKTSVHSHNNEDCKRALNKSSIKKVLSEELQNQSLEDVETQDFVQTKFDSGSRRSLNTSIYSAQTQEVLPRAQEDQSIQNVETQPFIPATFAADDSNLADVSIHSAATQKVETNGSENKPIEDIETQQFTRQSFSSDKRKSANTSIYSAETQKVIADVSNQSLDDIETQKFDIGNSDSKTKSADVSIYSAETQKIAENGDIENHETRKFETARASLSSGSHQIVKEDKNSISFSIQDIDTMPKYELSLDGKSNADMQNEDDDLLDSAVSARKSRTDKEIKDFENSKSSEQMPTPNKSDEPPTIDEVNENIVQDQKQTNETLSKSMSKSLLQSSSKDKSKSLVESDDEEEIFSQNLIENCPFRLLLDNSKNEQSAADLQNDKELGIDKTIDSEHKIPSNNQNNNIVNEDLVKKKSTIAANDDSETDEEGVFSSSSFKEKENETSHKEIGNDSETDEEGVFSNHLTEEEVEVEKSNSKPEGDSETDEEGVFSGRASTNSKKRKSSNNNRIINESESEDESAFTNNQSKSKASKDPVDPDENVEKAAGNSSFINQSAKKVISPSPKMEHSLNKVNEIIQAESPIPESDDDIFNENDEEKRTGYSGSGKINDPAIDKDIVDSTQKSSMPNTVYSKNDKNDNDNKDIDELAPTQIVETEDLSLAPTQIVNTNRASNWEEDRSEEVDDLAPTQLVETQNLQNEAYNSEEERSDKVDELAPTQLMETQNLSRVAAIVADSVKEVAQAYDDMDVAPTQKIVETQDCDESLAPTQKVVDTQIFSEEMGALQFSESLAPTQIIETEPNNVENEVVASPTKSPNKSKRQLEEVEITSNKKLKTSDGSSKAHVDLNSTVEQNLNDMFEGSEVKTTNIEEPIETQQLESILESSQIEETSSTTLDVSIKNPSPTLNRKWSNIRGKNRRRSLALNKSSALNETSKSVANLNDTIEQNLNGLFDNSGDNVETPEPEPMLTQQLEYILNSSQDSSSTESKKDEEGRTLNVSRKKSILSLSFKSLNMSMAKIQNDEEICSKNVQPISQEETTLRSSLNNEKSPQNEDYPADIKKDNVISKKITSENDKAIVCRRGTIGFSKAFGPVSTFDRIPFLDKYSSTSDSQSDSDDISPSTPSNKKRDSRDSKTTATTSTRTSGSATTNRAKRINDGDDDEELTHQPSPKRTKTLANHQKLQQAMPESTRANKRSTRAPKALDNHVVVSKTSRTDSSDMSAVESSIVEDKNESKSKSKVKGKPAARTRKAKVDRFEKSANSSKENLKESDVEKPKTRGRERKNQTTDSSVSEKESSRDEIPTSDVDNKSMRSTRGRLVRQNQRKKEEEKATIKDSKVIQDSDSEKSQDEIPTSDVENESTRSTRDRLVRQNQRKKEEEKSTIKDKVIQYSEESQKLKITVRKNTRNKSAKTVDESSSSKTDKIQDKDPESHSSSQSKSVTTRTTRTKKNEVNQESDSGSTEACEVATTSGSRRKPANNKSDIVVKLTDVDFETETMVESDKIKRNFFKIIKKKMNIKPEETSAPSARKTRTRTANSPTTEESSSEESQEVSEIMKNSVSEDSKTTTRRIGRAIKTNSGYIEHTEISDNVLKKPTSRPKRARLTKAYKNKSSHVSDTDEEPTQSSQKSMRKKHSPSPSPTLPSDATLTLTPSRSNRLSILSPTRRPKVLFTGNKSDADLQILTKLGGIEAKEFNSCSVLITDKVRRTFKFLCSLAQGIPIASVKWLEESKKANHFLDLEEYILNDPEAEAKFKFNLKESLDKARKHKLLEGYTIVLSKIEQPPIYELKKIVIFSGGKPLVRAPAKWPKKSIVVTTEQELDSAKKLIAKAPKSVTVQSVEFILTGILRQNINLNEFKLL